MIAGLSMPKQKRFQTDEKGVYFIEVGRLDKPGKIEKMYYFYFRDELGRQREEKAGRQFGPEKMTSTKARDKRSDRMRGITQSRKEIKAEEVARKLEEASRPTFVNLWKEYSRTLDKSLAADRSRFENHLKDLHDKTPDEIISLDIERIKNRLKKAKLSPQTIHHCLILIERIVNHGLEQHPPRCKPMMLRIKKDSFDNRVTEYLEPDQLQSLLAAIDADLKRDPYTGRAMLLALSTGMRRGALLRLKWADVSFTRDNIHLRDAKSNKKGKTFDIPLNEGAKRVFLSIPKTGSPYVFPGDKGGQRSDFNRGARRIRDAAGLPKGFRPLHGLRHHYASALVSIKDGSVDIYTLQKLMTHADTKTTERYATIADERLKAAAANANVLTERKVIPFPQTKTESAG